MQLHDILQLRTSVILPEAISDGGLAPTTDTSLFLTTYRTPLKKSLFCAKQHKIKYTCMFCAIIDVTRQIHGEQLQFTRAIRKMPFRASP